MFKCSCMNFDIDDELDAINKAKTFVNFVTRQLSRDIYEKLREKEFEDMQKITHYSKDAKDKGDQTESL